MITRALHDSGLHLIGHGCRGAHRRGRGQPRGVLGEQGHRGLQRRAARGDRRFVGQPAGPAAAVAVDDPRVAHVAEPATAALAGLREHEHWGFKDPRTCLTAAYWLDLEPELRFIICVRHPLEVALSLKRRNQNSYSLGLALWERYYATVLDQVPGRSSHRDPLRHLLRRPGGRAGTRCARSPGLAPAPPGFAATFATTRSASTSATPARARACGRSTPICAARPASPRRVETPADEGRVRRLILDGAVAQRHADQRQARDRAPPGARGAVPR